MPYRERLLEDSMLGGLGMEDSMLAGLRMDDSMLGGLSLGMVNGE
jgi:hypothetical protein